VIPDEYSNGEAAEELEFQILTLWMENVINAWWAALFIYISF
jgi:hypothetical protein